MNEGIDFRDWTREVKMGKRDFKGRALAKFVAVLLAFIGGFLLVTFYNASVVALKVHGHLLTETGYHVQRNWAMIWSLALWPILIPIIGVLLVIASICLWRK